MGFADPFYLGPLGAMLRLPGVPARGGLDVEHERYGGSSTSLRGRTTTDIWATRRTWEFTYPLNREVEAERLALRWRLTSRAVLRLLDPFAGNLLTLDASLCGAESRTVALAATADQPFGAPWATFVGASAASSAATGVGGMLVDQRGLIDYAARWDAAAGDVLSADTVEWRRPPTFGRATTFSAYVRAVTGQPNGTVAASITPVSLGNVAAAPVVGVSVAPLTSGWTRCTVTLPASDAYVSCYPSLVADAATTITTTEWQVEHGATATAWRHGGGAPEVVLDALSDGYRALGRRTSKLKLREV